MRFPNLFFGRKKQEEASPQQRAEAVSPTECAHLVLAPRWDSVQDIGHEDKAVGYRCTACGTLLTLEEGAAARRRHAITM